MLSRVNSWRVNTSDFETIKVLATGAVGTVCLVRAKADSKVYAMKTLKKIDLLTRQEAGFFMEERNALVFAQNSQWITTLHAAFQDEDNLYINGRPDRAEFRHARHEPQHNKSLAKRVSFTRRRIKLLVITLRCFGD
ncbi:hypothetical protein CAUPRSCDRAFT_12785 [Caulochytrium protostelioides]|uniref:Protein kinase domain-containing protein n=1 Tax=Caulochytrium protostelioides TaxID=1555241 RepID=A0A4P9WWD4_9FUNG|nr:hypothetical protein CAUPRSCDRAFT_12785 [Caulochytrium protostelioides]